jgi:enoyl-CoA hydratase/carnithine racemase
MVAVTRAIARVRSSSDMQEGIRAFQEKRPAVFRGQ